MDRRVTSLVVSPSFFFVGLWKTYIICVRSYSMWAKIITGKYQNLKQKIIVKLSNNNFIFL
jgi:hypothetical protein